MTLEQLLKKKSFWSKVKKTAIGAAATALIMGGVYAQEPGQYIPYLNQETNIVLTNPTNKEITGNVSYALMGNNPENGVSVAFDLSPFATKEIVNELPSDPYTHEGSGFVQASGDDAPVITAFNKNTDGTGMNIPIEPHDAKNNRDKQAGILQTGSETCVTMSGDSTSTNTIQFSVRGSLGGDPITTSPSYFTSNMITKGLVDAILNVHPTRNSSFNIIPKYSDQSKAAGILLYTNPSSADRRMRKMQNFTPAQLTPTDIAKAYVDKWLPPDDTGFYLDNEEIRAMINGDGAGTPSYAQELAEILVNSPGANGQTVGELVQWLKDQTDCDLSNGELCSAYEPLGWNNGLGTHGFFFAGESCDDPSVSVFSLDPVNVQNGYSLIRDDFLWRYVMNNPDMYGGSEGGLPSLDYNPEWNLGGSDSYQCQ